MSVTQSIQFGSGDVFLTPQAPFSTLNPKSYRFGILQNVNVDFSGSQKELYGKLRMPIAVAGTEIKVTGKAQQGRFQVDLFNYFFGIETPIAGQETNKVVVDEKATPATGTATVAHGADFVKDLGVYDTVTGLWMTPVSGVGAPTAGQYKVGTGGAYTFEASDVNPKQISYTHTTTATGVSNKLPNQAMGSNPTFGLYLANSQFQGIQFCLTLYKCGSNKLSLSWKNNDFSIPEFDFYAMDDGSGNIGEFNADQAA